MCPGAFHPLWQEVTGSPGRSPRTPCVIPRGGRSGAGAGLPSCGKAGVCCLPPLLYPGSPALSSPTSPLRSSRPGKVVSVEVCAQQLSVRSDRKRLPSTSAERDPRQLQKSWAGSVAAPSGRAQSYSVALHAPLCSLSACFSACFPHRSGGGGGESRQRGES